MSGCKKSSSFSLCLLLYDDDIICIYAIVMIYDQKYYIIEMFIS